MNHVLRIPGLRIPSGLVPCLPNGLGDLIGWDARAASPHELCRRGVVQGLEWLVEYVE
jgi:hypothetical protein